MSGLFGVKKISISIHTPLAGSDNTLVSTLPAPFQFQSTLPLRGVTFEPSEVARIFSFQSTLPLRGVTHRDSGRKVGQGISIHTPLAGSDLNCTVLLSSWNLFQSTLPLRGAT